MVLEKCFELEKIYFLSESEIFLDHYSESELHDLSNGAMIRAIRALLPAVWSLRKNTFYTHETERQSPNEMLCHVDPPRFEKYHDTVIMATQTHLPNPFGRIRPIPRLFPPCFRLDENKGE